MLGHNNISIEELAAENRRLRAELDAERNRADIMHHHLLAAWREHGVLPGNPGDGGTVTGKGAMQRVCVN